MDNQKRTKKLATLRRQIEATRTRENAAAARRDALLAGDQPDLDAATRKRLADEAHRECCTAWSRRMALTKTRNNLL